MSHRVTDVVVIGGGITGAFTAYYLSKQGASVTVVDPGQPECASSSNPGCLNPLHGPGIPGPLLPLTLASFALHRRAWPSLRASTVTGFDPRRSTRIAVALDPADEERLTRFRRLYDETEGFRAAWLERDELLEIEPRLSDRVTGGLLTEGDAKVDAAEYTRAVLTAARDCGAELTVDRCTGISRAGDRVTAVRLSERWLPCGAAIVATGAWTREPAEWLGLELPVEPVKGELLLVRLPDATDVLWRGSAVYRRDRRTAWLGGTEEHGGFDGRPSRRGRAEILSRGQAIWPGLGRAPVLRHVAGLRPVSCDGLPIVGRAPGWANVSLALGGGRKGMLLSAGLARAAAELALGEVTTLPIAACAPERFARVDAAATARPRATREANAT